MFCCKTSESPSDMDPKKLKEEVMQTGNLKSYKLLGMYYDGKIMDDDFLDISIMMYEKYSHSFVLSSIYLAFIYKYTKVPYYSGIKTELFKNVPNDQQAIALEYLNIGIQLGEYSCFGYLSDYYLSIGEKEKSFEIKKEFDELRVKDQKMILDSLSKHDIKNKK